MRTRNLGPRQWGDSIGFALDKWYFDCVSPDGDVLICYSAKLDYGPVRFTYGAVMTKLANGPLVQRQSFSPGCRRESPGVVSWSNDRLGVDGHWSGGSPIAKTTLADGPTGTIEWQCLSANAEVQATVNGRSFAGAGYVERLAVTIPPWRLPFSTLQWGRYIGDDREDYLVWIDLVGESKRNWIWYGSGDGMVAATSGTVDDCGVRTDGAELVFENRRDIRSENVARSLLGRFEFLKWLLPSKVRWVEEDKWVASCGLMVHGARSDGTSIGEVVTWV